MVNGADCTSYMTLTVSPQCINIKILKCPVHPPPLDWPHPYSYTRLLPHLHMGLHPVGCWDKDNLSFFLFFFVLYFSDRLYSVPNICMFLNRFMILTLEAYETSRLFYMVHDPQNMLTHTLLYYCCFSLPYNLLLTKVHLYFELLLIPMGLLTTLLTGTVRGPGRDCGPPLELYIKMSYFQKLFHVRFFHES